MIPPVLFVSANPSSVELDEDRVKCDSIGDGRP